jgi:hypothetical protein
MDGDGSVRASATRHDVDSEPAPREFPNRVPADEPGPPGDKRTPHCPAPPASISSTSPPNAAIVAAISVR